MKLTVVILALLAVSCSPKTCERKIIMKNGAVYALRRVKGLPNGTTECTYTDGVYSYVKHIQ